VKGDCVAARNRAFEADDPDMREDPSEILHGTNEC
jgi:hypothetical protein